MRGDSGDHVVRSPDSPWASRAPGHDHAGDVLGPPDHRRVVPDARRVSEGLDARAAFAVDADAGRHQTLSFAGPPGGVHTHVRLPPVCPLVLDRVSPLCLRTVVLREMLRLSGVQLMPRATWVVVTASGFASSHSPMISSATSSTARECSVNSDWAPFRLSGREAGSWAACPAARN